MARGNFPFSRGIFHRARRTVGRILARSAQPPAVAKRPDEVSDSILARASSMFLRPRPRKDRRPPTEIFSRRPCCPTTRRASSGGAARGGGGARVRRPAPLLSLLGPVRGRAGSLVPVAGHREIIAGEQGLPPG